MNVPGISSGRPSEVTAGPRRNRRVPWRALALGLAVGLLIAELALRASGAVATRSEITFGTWARSWDREQSGWILAFQPGQRVHNDTAEFSFEYLANSEGVIDREFALEAPAGRRRVLVLGDSFAQGAGAPMGQSWPATTEARLREAGLDVEVFNAGVSGSDPCFEYQLLRERLLRYRPDLVVVALNESDLPDFIWWGGLERFRPDGTTRGRPAPPGFTLFRYSHAARAVFYWVLGMDRMTLAFGPARPACRRAQVAIVETCEAIDRLRAEHPFRLLVLVHPMPVGAKLEAAGYGDDFVEHLRGRGIATHDVTPELARELADLDPEAYAWPDDGHFKAPGYAALGRVVARLLLEDASFADVLR